MQGFFPFLPGKRGGVLALLALLFHPFIKVGLGLTQVGAGDNGSAVVQQIADGGQGRHNALVAGDGAGLLILGHIEITAQKDFFAGNIHIGNGLFVVIHIIISLMDCDNGVRGAGVNGRRDTWVPPYNWPPCLKGAGGEADWGILPRTNLRETNYSLPRKYPSTSLRLVPLPLGKGGSGVTRVRSEWADVRIAPYGMGCRGGRPCPPGAAHFPGVHRGVALPLATGYLLFILFFISPVPSRPGKWFCRRAS